MEKAHSKNGEVKGKIDAYRYDFVILGVKFFVINFCCLDRVGGFFIKHL